jgi:RNA polymerase sigma-70 factor, ECF subfamily
MIRLIRKHVDQHLQVLRLMESDQRTCPNNPLVVLRNTHTASTVLDCGRAKGKNLTRSLLDDAGEHAMKNFASIESESKLIDLARSGNLDAFDVLIGQHNARVYSISLRMLRNREDAEDNLQNTMFKAFQHIKQFNKESQFSTWLGRIAINEALMFLRKPAKWKSHEVLDDMASGVMPQKELRDPAIDPEHEYMKKELVRKTLEDLPAPLKTVFVLHKVEGWTNAEMARALGVPGRRLKGRVFRARTILRKKLAALSTSVNLAERCANPVPVLQGSK